MNNGTSLNKRPRRVGSLSRRLLDRFACANVIAVDAVVMLLEMARVTLAGDAQRARIVEAEVLDSSWTTKVQTAASELAAATPSALLSTTALHWL